MRATDLLPPIDLHLLQSACKGLAPREDGMGRASPLCLPCVLGMLGHTRQHIQVMHSTQHKQRHIRADPVGEVGGQGRQVLALQGGFLRGERGQ